MSTRIFFAFFFCFIFFFRVFYGTNIRFWDDDEKHIYLLGLEFLAGYWPYFGADIVHTQRMIPGALQGLLVGLPLKLFPIPESPIFFINLLSFTSIITFSLFLKKHFSDFSFLFIFCWLSFLPWTLELGTHVYNPSYLFFPACLFFISFCEIIKTLRIGFFSETTPYFLAGLSFASIYQLHLSWPILVPFVVLIFWQWFTEKHKKIKKFIAGATGLCSPFILIIPTQQKYGWASLYQTTTSVLDFNWENFKNIPLYLIKIISLSTYEAYTFIGFLGEEKGDRLGFLTRYPWIFPAVLILFIGGITHGIFFIRLLFSRKKQTDGVFFRLIIFCWCWASFLFILTPRIPQTRNFYLLFPLSSFCSLIVMRTIREKKWGTAFIKTLLITACFFFISLSCLRFLYSEKDSLYSHRNSLAQWISEKNPYAFERPRYRLNGNENIFDIKKKEM